MRFAALLALLVLVFMLFTGSVEGGTALIALAVAVVAATRRRRRRDHDRPRPALRPLGLARFAALAFLEILSGAATTFFSLLRAKSGSDAGIVEIPLEGSEDVGSELAGLVVSASPGTVVTHISERRGVMVVHALDAEPPERVRARIHRLLRRSRACFKEVR